MAPEVVAEQELGRRIAAVRARIAAACARAGRRPEEVTLVAVSKTVPPAVVAAAARLGLGDFGENRVQEAEAKVPAVAALVGRPLRWHLVGTLQANKVNRALRLFAIIHSVDSLHLAEAINRRAAAPVSVLLEVYFGDDPRRPGFRPQELAAAAERIVLLPNLRVRGLMTVAPLGWSPAATRAVFQRLRALREELGQRLPGLGPELSMGMTDDFELAIEEGATIVRIGRAIFGERPSTA